MNEAAVGTVVFVLFFGLILGTCALEPQYQVYKKTQDGKAILKEAESSRKAQIEEAKANLESQKLNAKAEVERAKGAAKAIKLEGGKLTPEYIKYRWVMQMERQGTAPDKIYIPTEAGLPILEARK